MGGTHRNEPRQPGVLKLSDVMAQLSVGRTTVRGWILHGVKIKGKNFKLPALRLGSHYRVNQKDLDQFIQDLQTITFSEVSAPSPARAKPARKKERRALERSLSR